MSAGLDAGPATIAWHLAAEGLLVPSVSTIRRILHAAGMVAPEPRKRPRSSWIRFEASAPNEVWQSDFTHWRLADGSGVEIIGWLDDHSRYLLACTVFRRVSGDDVVSTLTAAGDAHGWPAATLTDNGSVCASRFTGGRNGFECLLDWPGIRQRNGAPGHPQTQGKIERFHQTLKRWLARQPGARDLAALRAQLDAFRAAHNERRPHAPPQGRDRPCPGTGPRHRRRGGGHGRRARDGRDPLDAPGRAGQRLLAQPATRPGPMAGAPADGLTDVSPMSRLKTMARPEGFEPPTLGSEDRCSSPLSYGRAAGTV